MYMYMCIVMYHDVQLYMYVHVHTVEFTDYDTCTCIISVTFIINLLHRVCLWKEQDGTEMQEL